MKVVWWSVILSQKYSNKCHARGGSSSNTKNPFNAHFSSFCSIMSEVKILICVELDWWILTLLVGWIIVLQLNWLRTMQRRKMYTATATAWGRFLASKLTLKIVFWAKTFDQLSKNLSTIRGRDVFFSPLSCFVCRLQFAPFLASSIPVTRVSYNRRGGWVDFNAASAQQNCCYASSLVWLIPVVTAMAFSRKFVIIPTKPFVSLQTQISLERKPPPLHRTMGSNIPTIGSTFNSIQPWGSHLDQK